MAAASTTVLRRMQERALKADQLLCLLKSQLEVLQQTAVVKACQKEEEKLKVENETLRKEVADLKIRLVDAETRNGIQQVPLPQSLNSISNGIAPVEQKQPPVQNVQRPVEKKQAPAESKAKQTINGDKKETKNVQKESKRDNKPDKKAEAVKSSTDAGASEAGADVSRLNMRIGRIVNVQKHPDADSLYVEEVDVGESKSRTIVSGLVKHVPLEEMQNRLAVFLLNLKPAKMRGILSEGMIMCASLPENVEIIVPPVGATVGERVIVGEYPGQPDEQLNPKKKTWEQIQPDLRINDDGFATYKGSLWKIEGKGTFKAPTMTGSAIK